MSLKRMTIHSVHDRGPQGRLPKAGKGPYDGIPRTREELPRFWADHQLDVGAEVGVYMAGFSMHILNSEPRIRKLYSIDQWCDFEGVTVDRILNGARKNLAPFGERSEIVHLPSIEASRLFKNDSLDFLYLDADHDHDPVQQDLIHWWPKIKAGGCLAGHDYRSGGCSRCNTMVKKGDPRGMGRCDVERAVNEFFGDLGVEVHKICQPPDNSFYVMKPRGEIK